MSSSSSDVDERGSAIIIALIVITVVGAVTAASLSYLRSSLASTNRAVRPERTSIAAADAAMQTAIAYVRNHPDVERALGLTCPASTITLSGTVVAVCPQAGSFAPTNPQLAKLLTLGANAAETDVTTTSRGNLVVYGDTFANAGITANAGTQIVVHEGRVWARRACTGTITVDAGTVPPACSFGSTPTLGVDPAYKPFLAARPANGVGSCALGIATIGPGTWTLARLRTAIGACRVVWFQPGSFYLNFPNAWNAVGLRIIGGTQSVPLAPFPGGCDPTKPGAQLIFAAASRIALSGGSTLDLCGLDTVEGPSTVKLAIVTLTAPLGAPPMAVESGCVIAINSCALLQGTGALTAIHIAGVVYAPRARFDFRPRGTSYSITDALVARAISVQPAVASPDVVIGTSGAPRSAGEAVFTASIGAVPWIETRIRLAAPLNAVPAVSSWLIEH